MANKLIMKKSSVAAKVPLSADLDVGEIAVNLVDQKLYSKRADGTVILVGSGLGGSGDVQGPASSTDNAIARFDLATGKVIQNSSATLDDSGNAAFNGISLTNDLPISEGGTGASTAAAAFANLKQAATETATGVVELATSAEAAAGTDTVRAITPAGLRGGLNASGSAPIYACRAWANLDMVAGALNGSGNISAITDTGVGNFRLTFATAMQDSAYAVTATVMGSSTSWAGVSYASSDQNNEANTTTTCSVGVRDGYNGWGFRDHNRISVCVFR